jgi:glycosyltransferase involved in cell wall biosynthesis
VLQVLLTLDPGGTERLVIEIARRLHPEWPMAVCCLDAPGAWAPQLERDGIAVSALHRRPGFRPALGRAIAQRCRTEPIDVIHAHHYSPFVYGAIARAWAPGVAVVFTEHGRLSDAPPSGRRRLANLLFRRLPRAVFAVSEDVKRHLVGEGFPAASVGVIYNGIDPGPAPPDALRIQKRQALGADEADFVIGTIARLDSVKDLGTLVRAAAALACRRRVRLLVVGDGPERQALERLSAECGIRDRVTFTGVRDDARDWLAGCDVYANSSISEGVSLTILEAMAAGLPVVATRVGGTPEVVNEACGRLVPPRDAAALARALGDLAAAPAVRRSLGREARRRVESQFTIDRMVQQYADVYRAVANRSVLASGLASSALGHGGAS